MKKKFICFAILILTAYILLYPADAVNASRNGLMLWYEKVLPTLLPFAIISNVLIHSGYMDALTKHLTKYFRFFMPVSGEGVFILCSGFLFGFPMGSKNCAELLILISLVEKLPLPKPVLILLENVLEITNGINCLANTDWSIQTKYILAMTATAFGGLSGIAQTSSMVQGTSLSMKKYCLVKLFLTLCTFLLAVAVSVFLF